MYDAKNKRLKTSIRRYLKQSSQLLGGILPFKSLKRLQTQRYFLPFYHLVRDEPCTYINPLYAVRSTKLFREDLEFLLNHFEPVDLSTLLSMIKGQQAWPKRTVMHLSFDDGLRECIDIIAPILIEKSIPASFFVNPNFINNQGLMFRYKAALVFNSLNQLTPNQRANIQAKFQLEKTVLKLGYDEQRSLDQLAEELAIDYTSILQNIQPYMGWDDLKQLQKQGFTIGSHSLDHPLYKKISLKRQLYQTIQGQTILEQYINVKHRIFAFPFTDDGVTTSFFHQLYKDAKFDLTFGGAGLKREVLPQHIHRFPMESDQLLSAQKMIKTEYFYFLIKAILAKNKIVRS